MPTKQPFKINWSDLTEECQKNLLEYCEVSGPEEMNWDNDLIPIAEYFMADADSIF